MVLGLVFRGLKILPRVAVGLAPRLMRSKLVVRLVQGIPLCSTVHVAKLVVRLLRRAPKAAGGSRLLARLLPWASRALQVVFPGAGAVLTVLPGVIAGLVSSVGLVQDLEWVFSCLKRGTSDMADRKTADAELQAHLDAQVRSSPNVVFEVPIAKPLESASFVLY